MGQVSQATGRFTILDHPVASPGHCATCGYSNNDRKYVDLRLDFEFYGTVVFCVECVGAMAQLFDFLKPAQTLALEARVEEAERECIQLRAAVAAFGDFGAAIAAVNFSDSFGGSVGTLTSSPSAEPGRITFSPTADSGSRSEDRQINKSSSESRRDDVHDATAGVDTGNLDI